MRLPRLLDGSLNEITRLHPSRLSVTETLTPLSTAEMVLPAGEPVVQVRQLVELYGQSGSFGIFRVAAVRTDWQNQQMVSLEHGAVTLEDSLGPEEYTATGSMPAMINSVLSWQPHAYWTSGTVEADQILTYNTGNQLGLQALLDLVEMVHGYALTFDQSVTPWRINLVRLPEEAGSECRLSRNVAAAGMTLDEAELCTRVTHAKLPGGYLDGPTVDIWGVIARPLDAPDDATEEQVLALAQEYLKDRKNPTVSVEIDGMDLSALTGESLDHFRVGDLCRMALPDYGTELLERIISINHPDVLGAPEQVKITLATQLRTAGSSLVGLTKTVDRNRRDANAKYKYIREELDKLVLEAPSIELISRVNTIEETLDDQILHMNEVMIRLNGAEAELLLKASQESYTKLESRMREAEIAIDGANAQITLKASQTSVDSLGQRVSAAEIAIDGAKSEIALKADLILLNGYVKASDFQTMWLEVMESAYIDSLNAGHIGCDSLGVNGTVSCEDLAGYSATLSTLQLGGTTVSAYDLTMGALVSSRVFAGGNIDLSHSHAVSVGEDGTVTLGEVSAEGGNFNIADTAYFKEAVAAAADLVTLSSDGWSGLTNTVRASNGKTYVVPFPEINLTGGETFDTSNKTIVNAVTPGSSAYITRMEVDASSVYSKGYNAGNDAGKSSWRPTIVTRTGVDTSAKTVTVSVSNLSQTLLTGQTVSCVEVYDAGYAAGWSAAAAQVARNGPTIYGPAATPGTREVKYTVSVGGSITNITNPQGNNYYATGTAYAYVNGTTVATRALSKNVTIA